MPATRLCVRAPDERPRSSGFGSPVVRDGASVLPGDRADAPRAGLGFPGPAPLAARPPASTTTHATRKAERDVRQPNEMPRRARLGIASPSGSEREMSRQGLADVVNTNLFATTGR